MEIVTFGKIMNRAIVFLHGWGGGFASFTYFAKKLSQNYYCIVCDMNSSFENGAVLGVDDFAEELNNKLEELKVSSVCLIGHSFGGRISAKFANLYPQKVEKIILVDSAGLPPRRRICYHIKVKRYKFCKWLVRHKILNARHLEKFGSDDYKNAKPNVRASFIKIVNEDLTKCFANLNCPTLIYWGELDKDTPLYMAKKLNKIIKDSGIVVVPGAGHFSYLDDPQKFLLVANAFLKNN